MLYFAYGMNTNLQGMALRCPAAESLGLARLLNYRFRFAGAADVVACPSGNVDGVLWNITDSCLLALDQLEGYPWYYDRKALPIEIKGHSFTAITYFMCPGHQDSPPSQGYLNTVLRGYQEHGVSTKQLHSALELYKNNTLICPEMGDLL
jgi:gamma-glutamylcyclotransferase (GGCT)/AIG2-like uncharacterized protein YtfP